MWRSQSSETVSLLGQSHQVERGGGREEGRPSQEKAGDQPSGDPFLGLQKESDKLLKMMDEGADKDAIQMQVQRYDSIGQIIAEADLEDEYEV